VIIIFMLVFHKQFQYMATGNYGFNREHHHSIFLCRVQTTIYLKTRSQRSAGLNGFQPTSDNMGKFASGSVKVKTAAAGRACLHALF
jgi:hypothetical protein